MYRPQRRFPSWAGVGCGASWPVTVPSGGHSPVRCRGGWESQLYSVSSTLVLYGLVGTGAAMGRVLAGDLDHYGPARQETAGRRGQRGLGSALLVVFGIRHVGVGSVLIGGGSVFDQFSEGIAVNHGPGGNLPHRGLGGSAAVSVLLVIRSRQAEFQGVPPGSVSGAFCRQHRSRRRVCRRAWGGGQASRRWGKLLQRGWRRRGSTQGGLWDPGGPRTLARPVRLQKFD